MREYEPSMTARGVALVRSFLERPTWPSGDAYAEQRLASSLAEGYDRRAGRRSAGNFLEWITARTRFFDDAVVHALERDVHQVVMLGAGYDGRALRFRTPGVHFFEVDHPATQADKQQRLRAVDASADGIAFVAADFTQPGLADALTAAGFDRTQRALFTCEGVLRYLPEEAFRSLLRVSAACGAPTSELAASVSTRDGDVSDEERSREAALAASGEAVLTVPPREVAMAWFAEAGWTVVDVDGVAGRGRLLVSAVRQHGE